MPEYLQGHHDSVLRSHRWRTAENSAAYLLPHLRPGMRVLDVGCGPGTITAELADVVGASGEVVGIDASEDVVTQAQLDHPATPTRPVRFAVADVMNLDDAGGPYDVVHAHQVLQHLQDPVGALARMRTAARPGGLVAVRDADYGAMTWYPASEGIDAWRALYRHIARSLGAEPDAGRRLLGWARQAGFAGVTPSAGVWCYATDADRRWWGDLQADRITRSTIADRARAAGLADDRELSRMADAWRAWADADDGWFAIVHGEVLCRVPGGSSAEEPAADPEGH